MEYTLQNGEIQRKDLNQSHTKMDLGMMGLYHHTHQLEQLSNDVVGHSVLSRKYRLKYASRGQRSFAIFEVDPLDVVDGSAFVIEDFPGIHESIDGHPNGNTMDPVVRMILPRKEWGYMF